MKNHLEKKSGHIPEITDVNVGTVCELKHSELTDTPVASIPVFNNDSYDKNEICKFIKTAKAFGFSSNEIDKILVYWNKESHSD